MIQGQEFTQERISHLARSVKERLTDSIAGIEHVNGDIHVLSINAKIQAARAGIAGAGFGVVADEVRKLVHRTQGITADLQMSVNETISELMRINEFLGTKVRGQRLSQVAANSIDIVDRNLYERSCDVRWWATEDAVVRALTDPSPERNHQACKRLGIILDSYTVYLDLVLCDLDGNVVANGRPERFASTGLKVGKRQWFLEAIQSRSGAEFGFEGVHSSPLADDASVLVYSCAVRKQGKNDGEIVGVLGIVFNWLELGKVVVQRAEQTLSAETDKRVRTCLLYFDGTIIASTVAAEVLTPIQIRAFHNGMRDRQGFLETVTESGAPVLAGYALSAGYETYKTGWVAVSYEEKGERANTELLQTRMDA